MAIRFLHTADIHFGMENYGHIDPKTGLHTRLIDFKNSFEFLVDYAITHSLDCFIFAGDAYKNCYPTPTQQRILIKLFLKLLEKNIPVVIIIGNHDHPGNFSRAHALDVFYHLKHPLCFVFSKISFITVPTKSGPLQIISVPWLSAGNIKKEKNVTSQEIKNYVLEEIKNMTSFINKNIPTVLVGHLTMETGIFSGSEKSIIEGKDPIYRINDFPLNQLSYVALGHLHRFQYINEKNTDQAPIVYSGSPDKIDFGEKNDSKSFCVVEVEAHKKTTFQRINIPCRNFYEIFIHIESLDVLEETVKEAIEKYTDLDSAIIKILYSYNYQYIKYIDLSFIEKYFKQVWHIATIQCINIHKIKKRETINHQLYQEKNIEQMVSKYIDIKEEYKARKNHYLNILKTYLQ
jgi:exonuclease SbcD